MKKKKNEITIKDIAKLCNVSIATVSRAVNNKYGVKRETKEKVLKIVEKYNYVPNIYARALVKREIKNIGLIFPYNLDMLLDLYLTELTSYIEDEAMKAGYDFTLYFPHSEIPSEIEDQYVELFKAQKVGGLLIGGVQVDDKTVKPLLNEGYPFILIGAHLNYLKYNYVDVNHKDAVDKAVSYLISKGLKRIAYIGSPLLFSPPIEKFWGYKVALKRNEIEMENNIVFHNIVNYYEAFSVCEQFIKSGNLPQAFFCENDMLAMGVLNALLKYNIKVPEQVSVIGYNDITISDKIYPALSTVRLPMREIASTAVKNLITLIETEKKYIEPVILQSELVLRATTI